MSGHEVLVDLNSDVGESFGRWELGDDEAVLSVVTSANVACGFHAGDATTLRRTCEVAVTRMSGWRASGRWSFWKPASCGRTGDSGCF